MRSALDGARQPLASATPPRQPDQPALMRLTTRSWERLQEAGGFDPTYLHLDVKDMA
jgi:hypothetical protein